MNKLRLRQRQNFWGMGIMLFGLLACSAPAKPKEATYANPVLGGDFPDPSVIRAGDDFWATATTSEWAPIFPLLRSRDLVNWKIEGAVFTKRPEWSVGNYAAPELTEFRRRYLVYYVARKKDGPLTIAVASAARPGGPYTDHGPLVSQEMGSIDPDMTLDEAGDPHLIWKEDGDSRKKPAVIWAQKLNDDGTQLVGERKELIRNDAPWEGDSVEGPFVLRHREWFYLFYSGNGCCNTNCNYALGVARAKNLLGSWEKNPANPILAGNDTWKCPGHGSIVADAEGHQYLLYHAYSATDSIYVGRQTMLDAVTWSSDWPAINHGKGPSKRTMAPLGVPSLHGENTFFDDFTLSNLRPEWQWPSASEPNYQIISSGSGRIVLSPAAAWLRLVIAKTPSAWLPVAGNSCSGGGKKEITKTSSPGISPTHRKSFCV
ncbi:MAG: family 43 glycosylhydrolase [Verrucomicrobia bacterium]|nr:family 43 glycosylhydrolase [Verrucomicrobiota bacterium]